MTLFMDEEGYGIRLSEKEWELLWEGKPIRKVTGNHKGYFTVNISTKKIPGIRRDENEIS